MCVRFDSRLHYTFEKEEKERLCPILFQLAFHPKITLELQERTAGTLARLLRFDQFLLILSFFAATKKF
jgi:hypothetical protein